MLKKYFIFFIFFNFTCITFAQDKSIKMKPVINLEIAKIMADACESHQKKTGYRPVNIAIVDSGGDLVLFRRQNNSFLLSIDIAIAKANSSAGIPPIVANLVTGTIVSPCPPKTMHWIS